jgi:hypothetical protein
VVALIGAVLFSASQSGSTALDLGLGIGGMERLAGYPSNLWIVVIALTALAARPRASADSRYAARPRGPGWADFQVRSGTAIRRHQTLVNCAFFFCSDTWFSPPHENPPATVPLKPPEEPDRLKRGPTPTRSAPTGLLARGNARRPALARPLDLPPTLMANLDQRTPTTRTPSPHRRRRHRPRP